MKARTCLLACAAALIASGSGACRSRNKRATQEDVVARIGDEVITTSDLEERLSKQSSFVRARYASTERKREFLDNLVRFEVIAAEARKRGYDKDPDVIRVVKQQMFSQFLQKEFESKLRVEDVPLADVERYYRENPSEFSRPEEVRASEILIKDKAKATRAAAEARALPRTDQKAFRELVARVSEDEDSKQRGGDLMLFDRNTALYPKPVVDAAFALAEVGDVSAPVKSDKGWHILKLTQRQQGFSRPLAEVKHQIQQRLFREMRAKALESFIAEQRKKVSIQVFPENLAKVRIDLARPGTPAAAAAPSPGPGAAMPAALAASPTPQPPAAGSAPAPAPAAPHTTPGGTAPAAMSH